MLEPTPEDLALVAKMIEDIKRLGPGAFLAQFCIWGNLHLQTLSDRGRGVAMLRSVQAMPVYHFLFVMTGCDDVPRVRTAMENGLGRALWHAKLSGRDAVTVEDAKLVMQSIVDDLK
jgi:hypothetical protein